MSDLVQTLIFVLAWFVGFVGGVVVGWLLGGVVGWLFGREIDDGLFHR